MDSSFTLILIVVGTLGAAFVEPLVVAYFFDRLNSREAENQLYPIFQTAPNVSYLVATLLFSTVLVYFDFKGLFLFVGILLLIFAVLAQKLKK